jgi:hypothetical protein
MPDFRPHVFDPAACRSELEELRLLLGGSASLSERQLRTFFRPRAHLRAFVGSYHAGIVRFDRLAWEYPLFGEFRCDFAVGDSARHAYTFVEFEDARPNSLFVRHGARLAREWGPRFEHGYSQVIDWFFKLHAQANTPDMEARFGIRVIEYTGVLIVGRDQHTDVGERLRLAWRRERVIVDSKRVVCVTYDQLVNDLTDRLENYTFLASGEV